MSLDEIFDGAVEPEVAEEAIEESEPEVVEKVEEDTEVESEDSESDTETTSEAEDIQEQMVPLKGLKDERKKRQEAERLLEEFKSKQADRNIELPDVFDDQKAFVDSIRSEYQKELRNAKIDIQRQMMIEANPDYEEKEQLFFEIAKDNPVLAAQVQQADNPAKFVMEQARKYEQFQEMQDIDTAKARLREEIRAELEAEFKGKQSQGTADIKPSLAKARATDKDPKVPETTLETLFAR